MRILFFMLFFLFAVVAEPCTIVEVEEFVITYEAARPVHKCGYVIDEHIIQTSNNYRNDAIVNGKKIVWYYVDNGNLYYYSPESLILDSKVDKKIKNEARMILEERIRSGFFIGRF